MVIGQQLTTTSVDLSKLVLDASQAPPGNNWSALYAPAIVDTGSGYFTITAQAMTAGVGPVGSGFVINSSASKLLSSSKVYQPFEEPADAASWRRRRQTAAVGYNIVVGGPTADQYVCAQCSGEQRIGYVNTLSDTGAGNSARSVPMASGFEPDRERERLAAAQAAVDALPEGKLSADIAGMSAALTPAQVMELAQRGRASSERMIEESGKRWVENK